MLAPMAPDPGAPPPLPDELAAWEAAGQYVTVGGHRLFVRAIGEPAAPPERTLLLVHGFPESSLSFRHNVEALAARFRRVVLCDLLGFGLSDKPAGHAYSLLEQAELLAAVWVALGVRGGHLLGHDMGDSVVTELLARQQRGELPAALAGGFPSVTFTDGNMVMARARLRLSQRLLRSHLVGELAARLSSYRVFRQQVRSASGARLGERDIELMWAALCHRGGRRVQHLVIRYLDERDRFEATRWLPALAATRVPVHFVWGERDAVSPIAVAEHLVAEVCPRARLVRLPEAGHFCQQEDPAAWNRAVLSLHEAAPPPS